MAILTCSGGKRNVLPRRVSSLFCWLYNTIMHVFAREGGNAELFWWKYERVVQREWQVCFVS